MLYFVFEGNFQVQDPGGLILGGAISRKVFCVTSLGCLYLEGIIHGGAYFRNFMVYVINLIFQLPEEVYVLKLDETRRRILNKSYSYLRGLLTRLV